MKKQIFWVVITLVFVIGLSGCAKKADPNRSIDKIKKDVEAMSVEDLETNARIYADALMDQKAQLDKLKAKMATMPVDKIFSNKFMTKQVTKIGQKAEALFERYAIYVGKLQEKGADLSKVRLE